MQNITIVKKRMKDRSEKRDKKKKKKMKVDGAGVKELGRIIKDKR